MSNGDLRADVGGQESGMAHYRFDLSDLVRRSVATLYSHLVTRPTGQALRLGIETQLGELGDFCVSVLDFEEVVVLDYSCADEIVAKLIQRFRQEDRPTEAFFVARGVREHHVEALETVLERHGLALVAELEKRGVCLLGPVEPLAASIWARIEAAGSLPLAGLGRLERDPSARRALDHLVAQRVVVRSSDGSRYLSLGSFLRH